MKPDLRYLVAHVKHLESQIRRTEELLRLVRGELEERVLLPMNEAGVQDLGEVLEVL